MNYWVEILRPSQPITVMLSRYLSSEIAIVAFAFNVTISQIFSD